MKIPASSLINDNIKKTETGIAVKLPEGSFVTPLNSKRSIRFVGYNEQANSSLFVVERWESSSYDDNSFDNYVLTTLGCDNKIIKTNDYSIMLLHAGMTGKEKIDTPGKKDSIKASTEKKLRRPLF